MKTTTKRTWLWIQRCQLTGETNEVYLTDEDRQEIEAQPSFRGWSKDELSEVES